jgi:CRISPR system Cascade subunit CasD
MMDVLILRFDAPLMSFGAPIVDQRGEINPYPALSMMTGLLGNALGVDHSEFDRLDRLQERLRYASRQDRRGRQIQDYQTVDLSKPYMDDDRAWTTRGTLEKRKGGSASSGTHIRYRDYWADAVHTVAVTLDPPDESPTLDDLAAAVRHPARPLFLGRKPCLPAGSLFAGRTRAESLPAALVHTPLHARHDEKERHPAWWPTHPDAPKPQDEAPDSPVVEDMRRPITDRRDWENQIHTGERWLADGTIRVTADDE